MSALYGKCGKCGRVGLIPFSDSDAYSSAPFSRWACTYCRVVYSLNKEGKLVVRDDKEG